MRKIWVTILLIFSFFVPGQSFRIERRVQVATQRVYKIEMKLSAFGVESDRFPDIEAVIDLQHDTGYCRVSYDAPKYKGRVYRLKKNELDSIRLLTSRFDIRQLHSRYSVSETDQPTSTSVFYLEGESLKKLEVSDYGLEGPSPLAELYRIVYKLDVNVK